MYARFKIVGIGLVIAGVAFMGVGGYTYAKTQAGANALNAFSAAQNVKLSYNDQGQLTDRGIAHRRIPPRTPKRNGKVERYQQTLAREWAYGQRYRDSHCRAAALPIWLEHYNYTRNHSSLSNRPPISRVRKDPRHNI